MEVSALLFVLRTEVINNDDVSDVDDVDLGDRWHATYSSADHGHCEVAEKVRISIPKKAVDLGLGSKV